MKDNVINKYLIKGTGKSYLIETLCMHLRHTYKDSNASGGWLVVVLAPTGLAAYNVNGQTIHRFFKLPVHKDGFEKHWDLADQALKIIRSFVQDIRLFMFGNYKNINFNNCK